MFESHYSLYAFAKLLCIVDRVWHGRVAQWIRHLTTNQGIPGSSPGMVESFLKGCF